jgi:hypothetical protein
MGLVGVISSLPGLPCAWKASASSGVKDGRLKVVMLVPVELIHRISPFGAWLFNA